MEAPQGPRLLVDATLRAIGTGITAVSLVYGFVISLLALFIELGIVSDVPGFWGLVVGVCIAPITFAIAPLYAGFRLGNWMPAIFCYGGMLTMYLAFFFGQRVSEAE